MNICLVSREYPPETAWGGIASYTHSVAHALADRGHTVRVLSHTRSREREYADGNVSVYRVHSPSFSPERWIPRTLILNCLRVAAKIRELSARYPIDVIEAPEWYAESLVYSVGRKIPVVVKMHAPRFLVRQSNNAPAGACWHMREALICKLEKIACLRADSLVTPCRSLAKIACRAYHIEPDRVTVIPNPVSMPERRFGDARARGRFVLYVGRLEQVKGCHVLGRAIPLVQKRFPGVKFVFCGRDTRNSPENGSMAEYLRKTVKSPNIEFAGHCERRKLFEYYRGCEICVIPSLWETFPYAGLEAMSCAKPVVGSRVGGMPDLIEDGRDGLLVPSGDPQELALALIRLLADRELGIEMGRRAAEKAMTQFSSRDIISRQVEHYGNVIDRFHRSRQGLWKNSRENLSGIPASIS